MGELVAMPGGPPGAIAVVQSGAEPTVHSFGVAEVGASDPPSPDDHMRIASVSKAFSGAAALALVDQGTLSLGDTVGQHLPDLSDAWANVTLEQLLNHTSGIPDFIRAPSFGDVVGASLDQAPPPRQLLALVDGEALRFPPGSEYEYSNSDNIVVGLMIESATGRAYPDVLAAVVLDPLGLEETTLPLGVELPDPFLHGYAIEDGGSPQDVSHLLAGGWAWASGGIVSTPRDLNDFIRSYVSGVLYDDDAVREAQQRLFIPAAESEPPGPGLNSATMALFRYENECGTMYGHSGNTVGYTQLAAASPDGEHSITMSITLQRTHNSEGQDLRVFQALQRAELAAMCLALAGGHEGLMRPITWASNQAPSPKPNRRIEPSWDKPRHR
jgi:D-alanyl-D-alanine carboxypeptidase